MCNKLLDKDCFSQTQGRLNYCLSWRFKAEEKKGTDPMCSEKMLIQTHQGELFHPIRADFQTQQE